mmetsp:Transcript_125867/g.218157  ORF Transcript_125867/g.218157 Transcript_125867/m.218157 type:complete len:202 (-) Transcript_125867:254-859(-)
MTPGGEPMRPAQVSKNTFSSLWGADEPGETRGTSVRGSDDPWGEPMRPAQVSKNTFSSLWGAEVCSYIAPTLAPKQVIMIMFMIQCPALARPCTTGASPEVQKTHNRCRSDSRPGILSVRYGSVVWAGADGAAIPPPFKAEGFNQILTRQATYMLWSIPGGGGKGGRGRSSSLKIAREKSGASPQNVGGIFDALWLALYIP